MAIFGKETNMMYMCKPITKENIVTMYDERVAELEHLLEKAQADYASAVRMNENANKRYLDDTNILASVLYNLVNEYGIERHHLADAMESCSYENDKIIQVLQFHEAVPNELLTREYYVTVTVPVSVCVTVTANDPRQAEEIATDEVDTNGIDNYHMEYDLCYMAEYEVEEA
jgi:hypothetical protein